MKTILKIIDEVNCQFTELDVTTRRKVIQELEYFVPGARYLPAVKLGRWNGKMSYSDLAGRTYINLLDRVLPIIQNAGYEIEIDDQRKNSIDFNFELVNENSYGHKTWPKGHPIAGSSIVIKDHQVEMINSYLDNLQSINIIPTAGGKTLVTGILSHKIEPYGRSLIIVPSKDLVTQTEQDYRNLGLDVGIYFGDKKEINKTHTICTWQSLEILFKNSKIDIESKEKLNDFLDGVVCVIADEVHRVKGTVLRSLLSGPLANIPIRWGLTGTMPEEEMDQLAVISCIGKLVNEIKTKDLQEKGILANIHINILQLQDLGEVFDNYQTELKWLTTNKLRIKYIASKVEEISESGNTLVLVDRIETGEMLECLIPGSVFVSGKMKSSSRKEEYAEIQELNNKTIIATYGIASTGTNIPRLFNLVLFEPGKAFVRVIQSIGRGLRVTPDKDFINVFDITSNSKYSKQHLAKRKKFYKEREYEYTIKKVQY